MIEGKANELPDFTVFQTVVKYCIFIITVPVLSFFFAKILFDSILHLEPISSSVYSAIVAVLTLHVTLGIYIYKAYNETDKTPPKPAKVD